MKIVAASKIECFGGLAIGAQARSLQKTED